MNNNLKLYDTIRDRFDSLYPFGLRTMKGGFFNMPLVEFKEKNGRSIKSRTLSNVQMELIKLYSTDLQYDDLMEVKKILANHFAQKAINEADNIWDQKKMSADTMEDWLNEN